MTFRTFLNLIYPHQIRSRIFTAINVNRRGISKSYPLLKEGGGERERNLRLSSQLHITILTHAEIKYKVEQTNSRSLLCKIKNKLLNTSSLLQFKSLKVFRLVVLVSSHLDFCNFQMGYVDICSSGITH